VKSRMIVPFCDRNDDLESILHSAPDAEGGHSKPATCSLLMFSLVAPVGARRARYAGPGAAFGRKGIRDKAESTFSGIAA
jgi:hypothetical protein